MSQPHMKLAARASKLSSHLWQGVAWETRIGHLMMRLAGSGPSAWGKAMFMEFEKAGIDTGREDGSNWGEKTYAFLKGRRGMSHEQIEDATQEFYIDVLSGKKRLRGDVTLKQAMSWSLKGILSKAEDRRRRTKRETEGLPVDEDGVQRDVQDIKSWGQLSSMLTPRTVKSILRELPKVHKDAVEWFQMVMNGLQNREIADQWGVARSHVSRWQRTYVPAIRKIVEKYIDPEALRLAI